MRVGIFTDMSMTSYAQLLAYLPARPADVMIVYAPRHSLADLRKLRDKGRITRLAMIKSFILYNILRLTDGPTMYLRDWRQGMGGARENEGGITVWSKPARIKTIRRLFAVPMHIERRAHAPQTLEILKRGKLDLLFLLGGYIQKEPVLSAAKYTMTVHHSYLPRHRGYGGGEIWALVNRDLDALGTTIIRTDRGVDTGKIVVQERLKVLPGDDLTSLTARNRQIAARLMIQSCDLVRDGEPACIDQDDSQATFIKGPPSPAQAAIGLEWLKTLAAGPGAQA